MCVSSLSEENQKDEFMCSLAESNAWISMKKLKNECEKALSPSTPNNKTLMYLCHLTAIVVVAE
jgi:hypothetical protein